MTTELRYFHELPKQSTGTNTQINSIKSAVSDINTQMAINEYRYARKPPVKRYEFTTTAKVNNLQQQIDDLPDIVQSDWDTTDESDMSYIRNKPNVPILDQSGQIPASYLPSYVDDILEYPTFADLPQPGEPGKIYVTIDNDLAYRWSGNTYVEISKSIVTGVKGNAETNYRIGNINLTAANIGLGNVVNIDQSKAIKSITRSGTTFTYTCLDGTTGTFTQQDTIYTLPAATAAALGGIKVGYTTSGKNYKVQLDSSNNAYVNVPWTDNNTTYSAGTGLQLTNTAFSVKLGYTTSGNNRAVQADNNGNLYVTQKDDNTTYSAGTGLSLTNTTFALALTKKLVTDALGYTPPTTDTNTHRPIQVNGTQILGDNTTALNLKAGSNVTLTNSSGTVTIASTDTNTWRPLGTGASDACAGNDSRLSNSRPASDVYAWAKASTKPSYTLDEISDGSSRKLASYLPLSGGTMTGSITMSQPSSARNVGIIGTYDYTKAAAIWAMGSSYQIPAAGNNLGSLCGAAYVYQSQAGQGVMAGGHQFVWAQNGGANVALGNNVWTSGGFIKNGGTSSQFLKADGSVDSNAYITGITKTMVTTALGYTPPTTNTTYSAGTGISLSGTTFSNSGVRATTINGNYLRVNTNGTNADLTIPYATSAGNADTVDSEHASAFAHVGAHNNLTASGNEFTFASSAFSGAIWINYRTAGGTNGNITQYNFGNGKGGNLASITSGTFNGDCTGSAGSVAWSNVTGKPSALPASDVYAWAKASTKPSYAWSEITSKPTIPTKTSQLTNDSGFITGGSFVAKGGDTMTGQLTMSNDSYIVVARNGRGITFGSNSTNTYIGADDSSMYICQGKNLPLRFLTNNGEQMRIWQDGKVAIGTTSAQSTFKFFVQTDSTNKYAGGSSAWANTSDIRKKDVISDIDINIQQIAQAPLFCFKWKDPELDTDVHVGSSAQYWQTVIPESIAESGDGTLLMEYGVTALASAITVAREVVEQDKKIKQLEEENKQLKEELQLLKSQVNDILATINKSTDN